MSNLVIHEKIETFKNLKIINASRNLEINISIRIIQPFVDRWTEWEK